MEVTVQRYNLPDVSVMESPEDFAFRIWQPDKVYAILGRANNPKGSLIIDNVVNDNIAVLQRPSGGEAVILSPGMLVFSVKMPFRKDMRTQEVFNSINSHLIDRLSEKGIKGLYSKGISDLSVETRKIMGSSMYLNRNTLFYHAVMNIAGETGLITKYLSHPTKEPDYRKGRSHKDFVSSLQKEGYEISAEDVAGCVKLAFKDLFYQSSEKEGIPESDYRHSFSL